MSVVTIGETMALLTTPARPVAGSALPVGIGGAESNVAIGLARLGVSCTWVGRVGDDAFGSLVVREIRAEGVRVLAARDPQAPTGLMVKELRRGRPWRVHYHRAGSAASHLGPDDVDADLIAGAAVLHLTGITPALGAGPRAAVERAVEVARSAGTTVSFDVNYRRALWSDPEAAPVLAHLAAGADVVFAGPEEATLVTGTTAPATFDGGVALARALIRLGARCAVVKLGALGSVAVDGDAVHHAPTTAVPAVDPVGAGDAFVAGYLAALVEGRPVPDALAQGNAAGGAVCRVAGDWEGLPTREELALAAGPHEVRR